MAFIDTIATWLRAPDRRSTREIEGDISEELEFHIAMRAQELVAAGMSPDDARRAAEKRFGDVERVKSSCRKIQLGDRIMLQRLNVVLIAVLLVGVLGLGVHSWISQRESSAAMKDLRAELAQLTAELQRKSHAAAAPATLAGLGYSTSDSAGSQPTIDGSEREPVQTRSPNKLDREAWLERFRKAPDWREALKLGDEIAALPPDEALALMKSIYHDIPSIEARQQILKSFVFPPAHVYAVEILHLAATDSELAVQGWAFNYLRGYAFQDFSADYAGYEAWHARYDGRPLGEILTGSAQDLVQRLGGLDAQGVAKELEVLRNVWFESGAAQGLSAEAAIRRAGGLDLALDWIDAPDESLQEQALGFVDKLHPDDAFLQGRIAPLLGDATRAPSAQAAACRALGHAKGEWAVDPLLDCALRELREAHDADENGVVMSAASALGELKNPRAIPGLIAMIAADDSKGTRYNLGYFALGAITGVRWDEGHDAAWWKRWWEENKSRLPESVSAMQLPHYSLHH